MKEKPAAAAARRRHAATVAARTMQLVAPMQDVASEPADRGIRRTALASLLLHSLAAVGLVYVASGDSQITAPAVVVRLVDWSASNGDSKGSPLEEAIRIDEFVSLSDSRAAARPLAGCRLRRALTFF